MEIRHYRDGDNLRDISRIYARSWKSAYRGIVPQEYLDALPEDRWAPLMEKEKRQLLLAADGDTLIGASTWGPARDGAYADWSEIVSIYLLPEYFRQGVGTALFRAAEAELVARGHDRIYLWVLEDNMPARRFYEKTGLVSAEML